LVVREAEDCRAYLAVVARHAEQGAVREAVMDRQRHVGDAIGDGSYRHRVGRDGGHGQREGLRD